MVEGARLGAVPDRSLYRKIPAKAGTQVFCRRAPWVSEKAWVPAFAGILRFGGLRTGLVREIAHPFPLPLRERVALRSRVR
ncbi:hypothetical protein DMC25_02880 [Caulobacter sp. D4A]|nr:hypothetical protein DMC18_19520 [Caulobacter sp. D5]PXA93995.1 hypothetical protein DMC25_02880 [Caulobacter sp. D4A]